MPARRHPLPKAAPSRSDRRKSPRADLVVRVDYQTVDELFSEFARNINEGGIFIESDHPHPLGTPVKLQFQVPGSEDPIRVSGAVVRVSEGNAAEPAGMGIEFENLDAEARSMIDDLVRSLRSDGPRRS
jgi:type IV pilus assembly protein PilZ